MLLAEFRNSNFAPGRTLEAISKERIMVVRILSGKGDQKNGIGVRNVRGLTQSEGNALINQISGGVAFRIGSKFVDHGETVSTVWADGQSNSVKYDK